MVARIPAAAAYAATDEPPLPLLSSSIAVTPCVASADIITVVPRSLKLAVGLNHSGLTDSGTPSTSRSSSGVRPSPRVIRRPSGCGRAAA
jgi:hypothetical protein